MTITIETTDLTPAVESGGDTVTTIVTQDTGTPAVTTVVIATGEPVLTVEVNEAGVPGPPGLRGPDGPPGEDGPPGGGAVGMTFTQDIPSTEWTIPHEFAYWPSVTVVDTAGNEFETEIFQADGVVTIRLVLATAGRAYLI